MKKYLLWCIILLLIIPSAFWYESYKENKNYQAGDQVINGSKLYECLPSPNSGWCKEGGFYEPWVGKYWRNAWKEIGEITNSTITNGNSITPSSNVIATTFIPTPTNRAKPQKVITPSMPSISVLGKSYNSWNYSLNWTIPVNGILWDMVELYENGKLISQKAIDPKSATKWGTFTIQNQSTWTFKYNIVMCLRTVCSSSGNTNITVYFGTTKNSNNGWITYNTTYHIPSDIQRVITSSTPIAGTPTVDSINSSNNRSNVTKVMWIVSKDKWRELFPVSNNIYSYEKFLQAVAKYPKFCWEVGTNAGDGTDTICGKELATLFTFYAYESWIQSTNLYVADNSNTYPLWKQGLYYTQIPWLNSVTWGTYFWRGSFLLAGQDAYRYISLALYEDENVLLKEPSLMAQDGYISLASGMWYYMTPKNQVPSMHDIVVAHWTPTSDEIRNGMEQGFWAVMQAFDTKICDWSGIETTEAKRRIEYYKEFASALWVSYGSNTSCKNLPEFSPTSYPVVNYFWSKNTNGECSLSSTPNNYYVFKSWSYEACKLNSSTTNSSTLNETNINNGNVIVYNNTPIQQIVESPKTTINSNIPVFKPIPNGINFEDLSKQIESELVNKIKSWAISKTGIQNSLTNFDTWINYLVDRNQSSWLTWTEKRSLLIILMMKDIYSKYE